LISRLLAIPIFFFMSWIFLNVLTVIHIFNDLNIHLMTFAVSINFLSPIANTSIFFKLSKMFLLTDDENDIFVLDENDEDAGSLFF
jgi:hypothetical protein